MEVLLVKFAIIVTLLSVFVLEAYKHKVLNGLIHIMYDLPLKNRRIK
jgi:hypothetical protein